MQRVIVFAVALALMAGTADAQEKVKIGVLKLTLSAMLFVGVEKGFFKEFGIEPELVFFQAAAPIATALAAGQIDVGATGLTAALYNIVLGGEKLWIVTDKGREWRGHPLTAVVVRTASARSSRGAATSSRGRRRPSSIRTSLRPTGRRP